MVFIPSQANPYQTLLPISRTYLPAQALADQLGERMLCAFSFNRYLPWEQR